MVSFYNVLKLYGEDMKVFVRYKIVLLSPLKVCLQTAQRYITRQNIYDGYY